MSAVRVGQALTIPDLPGRWSVWSKAGGWGPGAFFVVPEGSSGGGYAVIRAVQGRNDPHPRIEVLAAPGGGSR